MMMYWILSPSPGQWWSLTWILAMMLIGYVFIKRTWFHPKKKEQRHFEVSLVLVLAWIIGTINLEIDSVETRSWHAEDNLIEEIEIPVTVHRRKASPPPPPVKMTVSEILEVDTEPLTEPDYEELDPVETIASNDTGKGALDSVSFQEKAPKLPKPEEPEAPVLIADFMPYLSDCDGETDNNNKYECTKRAVLAFFHRHVNYPEIAKENRMKGTVVMQFVIDEEGRPGAPKLLRDIGGGCGAEVLATFEKFRMEYPEWKAGRQAGRRVAVYFTVPIRFRLK